MTRGVLEYSRRTRFESTNLVRFGPFELDLSSRELTRGPLCVRLQTQPFETLQMLLEHRGEVVTRAELRNRLCLQEPSSRAIADAWNSQHEPAELRGDRDSPMKL